MRQPGLTRVPEEVVQESACDSRPTKGDDDAPAVLANVNEWRTELGRSLGSDAATSEAAACNAAPSELEMARSPSMKGAALKTGADEGELDDVIRQHMERWLQRGPDSASAVPLDEPAPPTSPPEESSPAAVSAATDPSTAAAEEAPRPRREAAVTPREDLLVLRELANVHVRGELQTVHFDRSVRRAQRLLTVAVVAIVTSFVFLQFSGPKSWGTMAGGMASLLVAALWTHQYFGVVRRLTTER
jgi:hypothetical protein